MRRLDGGGFCARGRTGVTRRTFVLGLVLTGGAMIGCTEERADLAQIAITTRDFSFEAPSSAPGGTVRITVDNQGTEPHQVELVRVRRGADQNGVIAAVLRMDAAALNSRVTYHGGPNEVPPGEQRTTITELESGRYVMLCFVEAPWAGGRLVDHLTGGAHLGRARRRTGDLPVHLRPVTRTPSAPLPTRHDDDTDRCRTPMKRPLVRRSIAG